MVGRRLEEIELPGGVTIAAVVSRLDELETVGHRGIFADKLMGHVEIAHHDTVIKEGDHVIVFCTSKKLVTKVEKLFQVGFGFL